MPADPEPIDAPRPEHVERVTAIGAKEFRRVPAGEAYRTAACLRASQWPCRAKPDRLEPVCMPQVQPGFALRAGDSVFTIGSCFARHIELALREKGMRVPALDFTVPSEELWTGTRMQAGILNKYTPFSMLNEVRFALGDTSGAEFLIETAPGKFWDAQLHTTESVSFERGLERRSALRKLYRDAIFESPLVVITLGLVEAWWDAQSNCYLNETVPKKLSDRHPGRFWFEVLSPQVVIGAVSDLLSLLHDNNPTQHVLLTVSPIPLQRSFSGDDVIIANAYSKSLLRVAAEVMRRRFAHVSYYPSFESVTHSDRTLAWEDDLVHVRLEIVAANVDRMLSAYCVPNPV